MTSDASGAPSDKTRISERQPSADASPRLYEDAHRQPVPPMDPGSKAAAEKHLPNVRVAKRGAGATDSTAAAATNDIPPDNVGDQTVPAHSGDSRVISGRPRVRTATGDQVSAKAVVASNPAKAEQHASVTVSKAVEPAVKQQSAPVGDRSAAPAANRATAKNSGETQGEQSRIKPAGAGRAQSADATMPKNKGAASGDRPAETQGPSEHAAAAPHPRMEASPSQKQEEGGASKGQSESALAPRTSENGAVRSQSETFTIRSQSETFTIRPQSSEGGAAHQSASGERQRSDDHSAAHSSTAAKKQSSEVGRRTEESAPPVVPHAESGAVHQQSSEIPAAQETNGRRQSSQPAVAPRSGNSENAGGGRAEVRAVPGQTSSDSARRQPEERATATEGGAAPKTENYRPSQAEREARRYEKRAAAIESSEVQRAKSEAPGDRITQRSGADGAPKERGSHVGVAGADENNRRAGQSSSETSLAKRAAERAGNESDNAKRESQHAVPEALHGHETDKRAADTRDSQPREEQHSVRRDERRGAEPELAKRRLEHNGAPAEGGKRVEPAGAQRPSELSAETSGAPHGRTSAQVASGNASNVEFDGSKRGSSEHVVAESVNPRAAGEGQLHSEKTPQGKTGFSEQSAEFNPSKESAPHAVRQHSAGEPAETSEPPKLSSADGRNVRHGAEQSNAARVPTPERASGAEPKTAEQKESESRSSSERRVSEPRSTEASKPEQGHQLHPDTGHVVHEQGARFDKEGEAQPLPHARESAGVAETSIKHDVSQKNAVPSPEIGQHPAANRTNGQDQSHEFRRTAASAEPGTGQVRSTELSSAQFKPGSIGEDRSASAKELHHAEQHHEARPEESADVQRVARRDPQGQELHEVHHRPGDGEGKERPHERSGDGEGKEHHHHHHGSDGNEGTSQQQAEQHPQREPGGQRAAASEPAAEHSRIGNGGESGSQKEGSVTGEIHAQSATFNPSAGAQPLASQNSTEATGDGRSPRHPAEHVATNGGIAGRAESVAAHSGVEHRAEPGTADGGSITRPESGSEHSGSITHPDSRSEHSGNLTHSDAASAQHGGTTVRAESSTESGVGTSHTPGEAVFRAQSAPIRKDELPDSHPGQLTGSDSEHHGQTSRRDESALVHSGEPPSSFARNNKEGAEGHKTDEHVSEGAAAAMPAWRRQPNEGGDGERALKRDSQGGEEGHRLQGRRDEVEPHHARSAENHEDGRKPEFPRREEGESNKFRQQHEEGHKAEGRRSEDDEHGRVRQHDGDRDRDPDHVRHGEHDRDRDHDHDRDRDYRDESRKGEARRDDDGRGGSHERQEEFRKGEARRDSEDDAKHQEPDGHGEGRRHEEHNDGSADRTAANGANVGRRSGEALGATHENGKQPEHLATPLHGDHAELASKAVQTGVERAAEPPVMHSESSHFINKHAVGEAVDIHAEPKTVKAESEKFKLEAATFKTESHALAAAGELAAHHDKAPEIRADLHLEHKLENRIDWNHEPLRAEVRHDVARPAETPPPQHHDRVAEAPVRHEAPPAVRQVAQSSPIEVRQPSHVSSPTAVDWNHHAAAAAASDRPVMFTNNNMNPHFLTSDALRNGLGGRKSQDLQFPGVELVVGALISASAVARARRQEAAENNNGTGAHNPVSPANALSFLYQPHQRAERAGQDAANNARVVKPEAAALRAVPGEVSKQNPDAPRHHFATLAPNAVPGQVKNIEAASAAPADARAAHLAHKDQHALVQSADHAPRKTEHVIHPIADSVVQHKTDNPALRLDASVVKPVTATGQTQITGVNLTETSGARAESSVAKTSARDIPLSAKGSVDEPSVQLHAKNQSTANVTAHLRSVENVDPAPAQDSNPRSAASEQQSRETSRAAFADNQLRETTHTHVAHVLHDTGRNVSPEQPPESRRAATAENQLHQAHQPHETNRSMQESQIARQNGNSDRQDDLRRAVGYQQSEARQPDRVNRAVAADANQAQNIAGVHISAANAADQSPKAVKGADGNNPIRPSEVAKPEAQSITNLISNISSSPRTNHETENATSSVHMKAGEIKGGIDRTIAKSLEAMRDVALPTDARKNASSGPKPTNQQINKTRQLAKSSAQSGSAPEAVFFDEIVPEEHIKEASKEKLPIKEFQKQSELMDKETYVAPVRSTYIIKTGDTLTNIAERLFGYTSVGWLIADVNRGRTKETVLNDQRVVKLYVGQLIELPTDDEIEKFLGAEKEHQGDLITLVYNASADSDLVESILGKIV